MIPFMIMFSLIMNGSVSLDNKPHMAKAFAIMFSVQLTISAFIPQIAGLYQGVGENVAEFVIKAKKTGN